MDTEFKTRLLSEKARLERSLSSVGKPNEGVPNDWIAVGSEQGAEPDSADQADVIASHEGNAAILDDLEARYDGVLAALARIDDGTYGTCAICGARIEPARLHADLTATTCIAHKEVK